MRIDIITCCPELLESPLNHSIIQRAKNKGLCEIYVHNLRDWTLDKHRKVDDYAFGFGAGMVLQIEPIDRLITHLTSERHYDEIIFTAPDGERFDQKAANELSLKENIIILCGHYKGVDQRVRDHLITREYSIGDFAEKAFQLFDSEHAQVELLCENTMMNTVLDHFGDKVKPTEVDKDHFSFVAEVSVSPTFFAWVFQFGGKIRILKPDVVIDEFENLMSKNTRN